MNQNPKTIKERPIWTPHTQKIKHIAKLMDMDPSKLGRDDFAEIISKFRTELEWCLFTKSNEILAKAILEVLGDESRAKG